MKRPTIRPLRSDFMTIHTHPVWTVTTIQAATSIQSALIFMLLAINYIIITINADSYFPPPVSYQRLLLVDTYD